MATEWTPLPEDVDERAAFDRGTKMYGDVRIQIAHALRIWSVAHPGGTYADMCRIMANEVAKLGLPTDGVSPTQPSDVLPSPTDGATP